MRVLFALLFLLVARPSVAAYALICPVNPGPGVGCSTAYWGDLEGPAPFGHYYTTAQDGATSYDETKLDYRKVGSVSGTLRMIGCVSLSGCAAPVVNMPVPSSWVLGLSGGCVPSMRTVDPCPAGFAPAAVVPTSFGPGVDPYGSSISGLPVQDMIYAVGITLCALLGVVFGVRLT